MKKKTIRALGLDRNVRPPRPVDVVNRLRSMRGVLLEQAERMKEAIERIEARPQDHHQRNA